MKDRVLYVGSARGLFRAEGNGNGYAVTPTGLQGKGAVRCPVVIDKDGPRMMYAGTTGGAFRTEDGGATWQECTNQLAGREVWWLDQHPKSGTLWAGTGPSAIFRSDDRGDGWQECTALQSLPRVKEWTFPMPPHISHVKHLSLRPDDPNDVVAAIEEGWLVRTTDGGASWTNMTNGTEFDSHTAYFVPDNQKVIVSTSGTGVYRSEDGGESFVESCDGLDRRYLVHLVMNPAKPNLVFTAGAEVPPHLWGRPEGGNSAFYRSENQGRSWQRLRGGLPDPMPQAPRCASGDPDDPATVYAGLTDGSVWATHDGGESFAREFDLGPLPPGMDWRAGAVSSVRVARQ